MNDKELIELFINSYIEMIIDDINAVENSIENLFEFGKRLGLISALKTLETNLIIFYPDLAEKVFDYDIDKRFL